jgi:hypothetical protein
MKHTLFALLSLVCVHPPLVFGEKLPPSPARAPLTPEETRYCRIVTDFTLPWIHRMITQSDTLFPDPAGTKRTGVLLRIDKPLKGYVPFWWDQGQELCIVPEQIEKLWQIIGTVNRSRSALGDEFRFHGCVKAVSQHMAQYIAVMLMETGWHTQDPRAMFRRHGHLPFAIDYGDKPLQWGNAGPSAKISHLYGCAFAISAAAQHLLCTEGKSHWPAAASTQARP